MSGSPQSVHDRLETSLVSFVIERILGMLELAIVLVNCVVSKMNKHVVYVSLVQTPRLELFCRKTYYAFMVQEDFKWVTRGDENI